MKAQKQGQIFLYILSVVYVISMYIYPVLFFLSLASGVQGSEYQVDMSGWVRILFIVLPLALGFVNLITVIVNKGLDRSCFLNCAMIIKYLLVPFYLFGGLCVVLAWLILFIPVPGVNFVGPIIGMTLAVMGYTGLIGAAPVSLAYIIKAGRDKKQPGWLCVLSGIAQFIFTLDVIAIMILSVKEGKGRFAAIAAVATGIFFMVCILFAVK